MKFRPLYSFALALLTFSAASVAPARDLVIHAGTLLDAVTEQPMHQVSILVHDDRIVVVRTG